MSVPAISVAYDDQIFGLQQFGGISRYFCELASRIPALAQMATRVIAPIHFNQYLDALAIDKRAWFRPIPFRGAGRIYRTWNRIVTPPLMAVSAPSVVHWTYFRPGKATSGAKTILTVYDMIHELFAAEFPPGDRTSMDKRRSVDAADHIVCISQSTKADLVRLFGVPEHKISVTHLACSDAFTPLPGPADEAWRGARPYLLYVGQRRSYKGFADAVRAYASARSVRESVDLIAFGGPAFDPDELSLISSLGLHPGAVRRVVGDDAVLAAAYRSARAFIYPSQYEGFGIPPLEAMACGCPVAASNTSSIPEVVGTAAQLFEPGRIDSIAAAMERVCFDDALRRGLVERGLRQTASFSWDRCALETAAVYTRVLGR